MNHTDADTLGFDLVGPTPPNTNAAQSESPEQRIARTAIEVALLFKGQEVHLRDIKLNEDGTLKGEVSGFSNVCAREFESVRFGQSLSFRYQHIQHSTKYD
ncbi:hypothetical protein ACMXYV_17050 [Neptuniibacter sp. SY11_33]|uniref:hypothetical protein n=1 Tax=Neptuniibacter sp. SY11_33 TaxID=3398215 RepID=UPI0039F611C9